jgi:hypothetical protein
VNSQFHICESVSAIGNDSASIFKFATHENSIVNAIITKESQEADKKRAAFFLKPLANHCQPSPNLERRRNMIDLCKVVKTIIITHTKAPPKSGVAGKPEFKPFLKEIHL